jgi:hypothetical protein
MDICEDLSSKAPEEIGPVTELISRCTKLTYLYLALRPSMAYYCGLFAAVAGELPELRQLVFTGFLAADHVVGSVAVMLASAKSLEVLSLFPLDPEPLKRKNYYDSDDDDEDDIPYYDDDNDDDDDDEEEEDDDNHSPYAKPENCVTHNHGVDYDWMATHLWRMHIPCLGGSLRRINIANYNGNAYDRILAKFLLSKAAALEEFLVTLSPQVSPRKKEIAAEFRSWQHNPGAIVTCTPSVSGHVLLGQSFRKRAAIDIYSNT